MSWRATVFWSLLAAFVGFGLFHVKYQVQKLEDRLAKLNRDIVREQEQIHVLRAEWTYLDRPERIEQLAKKYLELAPPRPDQIGYIDQLPMRPADAPTDPTSATEPSAPPSPARRPSVLPRPHSPAPIAEDRDGIAPTPVAVRSAPPDAIDAGKLALPGGGR